MKYLIVSFVVCFLFFSCTEESSKSVPVDFLPENPSFVIKIANMEGAQSTLKNSGLFNKLSASDSYQAISKKIEVLKHFKSDQDVYVSFVKDAKDSLQFSVAANFNKELFNTDSIPDLKVETISIDQKSYQKTTIANQILYSVIKDSVFVGASSRDLLENALSSQVQDQVWMELIQSSNVESNLSVLVNNSAHHQVKNLFYLDSLSAATFSNYYFLDLDIEQDAVTFNGVTKATDSTKSLVNAFKNTSPQENQMASVTPSNSDGFLSLTFNNYSNFKENLQLPVVVDSLKIETTLLDNVTEVGMIFQGDEQAVVLYSLDETSTSEALPSSVIENYRQIDIHNFHQSDVFYQSFGSFIPYKNATKYCVIDSFFVFADSMELLQNIIANYQNGTTLIHRSYYEDVQQYLSDESSLLMVTNDQDLPKFFLDNLGDSFDLDLTNYNASAIQFIYDQDFAHVNGVIKKSKVKAADNSVSEEINVQLDAPLLNDPQFVINHLNNEKEVVVQDIKNNLYLISNTGKVLWKKQLSGAVMGDIQQIDMYKNGRLQLAFTTPNNVYVVDRNGRDVVPFPKKFNDNLTQPLAVFDYDNNRNYRLVITQGKDIYMVDAKGQSVKGFTFDSASEDLIHEPQHIRIGRKDYLLFKTKNKLYVLDRVGKPRVSLKSQYEYSKEGMYEYENKFITTASNGVLLTIDQNGNTASRDIQMTDRHHLITTSKTLVALSENRLTIKDKTLELDYGNYSKPDIFYIYDKIYVTVTDLQTQKVHLFDSNGVEISNFPVYGNSKIDLDNIDGDRQLEFVTKGEDNTILIYQIN